MKGVLPWLVRWACHAGTRDFLSCVGCSSRPSTKYFFITIHYFTSLSPSPSKLGRQSCWVAGLLICVSVPNTSYPHSSKTTESVFRCRHFCGSRYTCNEFGSRLFAESDNYISTTTDNWHWRPAVNNHLVNYSDTSQSTTSPLQPNDEHINKNRHPIVKQWTYIRQKTSRERLATQRKD